ncbi:MAG: hypothetical protein NWE96_07680 [Candidatus Bathyarchaeota archaeon]|nr:hypothetical protein [Candidatus Bathyarchaeota archaeon]
MTDWVKRALTRKTSSKRGIKEEIEPDERLVLGTKVVIALIFCLTALEISHLAFLGTWSSEVFAAITGLTGTVTGILISQKSR